MWMIVYMCYGFLCPITETENISSLFTEEISPFYIWVAFYFCVLSFTLFYFQCPTNHSYYSEDDV